MLKKLALLLGATVALSNSAQAQTWSRTSPDCYNWVAGSWDLCTGAYDLSGGKNVNGTNGQDFADFLEGQMWADNSAPNAFDKAFTQQISYVSLIDDNATVGQWTLQGVDNTSGTITATNFTGPFILGLKASNTASFYYFSSYSAPITFNTIGSGTNNRGTAQDLSGIRIFTVASQPVRVPEPASFTLVAAGLAGLAVVARRRKA